MKAARTLSFEVRRNRKTKKTKGVKLNAIQNGYFGFLIFFDFDSQNSKLLFFQMIAYKIRNFQVIQNTVIYVIEIHTNDMHENFKTIPLFLAVQWPKETGKGDDVTFLKCLYSHF